MTNTPFFQSSRSIPNSSFHLVPTLFLNGQVLCLVTDHCHWYCGCRKRFVIQLFQGSYHHQTAKYWKKIHVHCLPLGYSCATLVWKGAGLSFEMKWGWTCCFDAFDVLKYPELYQTSVFPSFSSCTLPLQFCIFFEMALVESCSTSTASSWGLRLRRDLPRASRAGRLLWAACLPLGAGVRCSSNLLPHTVFCPASTCVDIRGGSVGYSKAGVQLQQGSFPNPR